MKFWTSIIWLKVAVYLQRCLASRQCSASSLNCRYLNPYIKLSLQSWLSNYTKKFEIKGIVESFMTTKCQRPNHLLKATSQSKFCFSLIGHFTVVCLVTWPWIGSEAGGDLVLIQTSLFFICKCNLVSIRTAWSTPEKQQGLYQNKVTPSLASNLRPSH